MRFERYGDGDYSFLCLHGWNGGHATFEPLAKLLPPGVSLWCPDLPACDTIAQQTAELAEFAARIPGPLRIVGNCSGAAFGLRLARELTVERLVMIDAFAYIPLYFGVFVTPVVGRLAYYTAFANPVGRWFANSVTARHRARTTDLTAGFRRVNHEATFRQLQLLAGMGRPEDFRGIGAKIDIVFGAKTFRAIRKSAAIWKEVFPEATIHELRGAGHLPILEATSQLRDILLVPQETPCTV